MAAGGCGYYFFITHGEEETMRVVEYMLSTCAAEWFSLLCMFKGESNMFFFPAHGLCFLGMWLPCLTLFSRC